MPELLTDLQAGTVDYGAAAFCLCGALIWTGAIAAYIGWRK